MKVFNKIICFILIFALLTPVIVTDSIVYELSDNQYRGIIALLTVIAFSTISNCVIALTRKG